MNKLFVTLFCFLLLACSKDHYDGPVPYDTRYEEGKSYTQTFLYTSGFSFRSIDSRVYFDIQPNEEVFHTIYPSAEALKIVSEKNEESKRKEHKYYLSANIHFDYTLGGLFGDRQILKNISRLTDWHLIIGREEEYTLDGKIYERVIIVEDLGAVPVRTKPADPTEVDNNVAGYAIGQRYIHTFFFLGDNTDKLLNTRYFNIKSARKDKDGYTATYEISENRYPEFSAIYPPKDLIYQLFDLNNTPYIDDGKNELIFYRNFVDLTANINFIYTGISAGMISNLKLHTDWCLMREVYQLNTANGLPVYSFIPHNGSKIEDEIIGKWKAYIYDATYQKYTELGVAIEFKPNGIGHREDINDEYKNGEFKYSIKGCKITYEGIENHNWMDNLEIIFDEKGDTFYSSMLIYKRIK
jgi:hypothetical protein|nr:MAG TPA: hypothetical protein [Bacteriophage sp.]